jgi:3-hydroxyisobutyrate dehydrogenase-like beta-hydroxyacid dehydrogenase
MNRPTVAILAPGAMGAAVARRLNSRGLTVLTDLEGRSAATSVRAAEARMRAASLAEIVRADLILSIVPPSEAVRLAERVAEAMAAASSKAVFVECNAINPAAVGRLSEHFAALGLSFVDASIIGMPPRDGYDGPAFFACGEAVGAFERLSEWGLLVRRLDGPPGAASALKTCYGGITKGLIAIGSAMMLAAVRSGADQTLFEEMSRSQVNLLQGFSRSVPDMFGKAGRWVAEMEQIAEFLGADRAEADVFRGFARYYERLGLDQAGLGQEIAQLSGFLSAGRQTPGT